MTNNAVKGQGLLAVSISNTEQAVASIGFDKNGGYHIEIKFYHYELDGNRYVPNIKRCLLGNEKKHLTLDQVIEIMGRLNIPTLVIWNSQVRDGKQPDINMVLNQDKDKNKDNG